MPLSAETTVKEIFLSSCERNDLATVGQLLDLQPIGADVDWKDVNGGTGLHIAAGKNYMELLELLLAHGANVNIKDRLEVTPLMLACFHGHENIARRLCRVPGLEVNTKDRFGQTALFTAVGNVKPVCVSVLREVTGVDWNAGWADGYSPLTVAVWYGHADILQVILSVPPPHLDLGVTDDRGRNIAQIAVEEIGGDRQRCIELLSRDRRVDWNTKNGAGDTPVMYCLKNNKIEMARCLINTPGVDLNISDSDGQYPENIARKNNLREILGLMWGANGTNIQSRIPECPVCLVQFRRMSEVHQCGQGHFVCGDCRPRVRTCPICRGILTGRCHGFEEFLQALNVN